MFKESLNKVNSKKFPHILNLNSMRLGVNTIMKLISILETHQYLPFDLASQSLTLLITLFQNTECMQLKI